jgi:hypothetical protein
MPLVDNFKYTLGTSADEYSIGLNGAKLERVSENKLKVQKNDDSGLANLEVATPTSNNDAVNKITLDKALKPVKVGRQADCSTALPSNTGTAGYVVVTKAGNGANLGDLLYDDGTSTGTMEIIVPTEGDVIVVNTNLTGNDLELKATYLYLYKSSSWSLPSDSGSRQTRVVTFDYEDTTVDSELTIPVGARVTNCVVYIETAFSTGATIEVGDSVDADLYQPTTHNKPTKTGAYETAHNTVITTAHVVRVTLGGTPTAGAGTAIVDFIAP